MQERVAVIEAANRVLRSGELSDEQRAAAASAAHKLAGVLGTFGLTAGTNLAREAEEVYAGEQSIEPNMLGRLETIAQLLTETIQAHN
jgi:HPt (histidine-containing phosphotransfer) domain-containing protein